MFHPTSTEVETLVVPLSVERIDVLPCEYSLSGAQGNRRRSSDVLASRRSFAHILLDVDMGDQASNLPRRIVKVGKNTTKRRRPLVRRRIWSKRMEWWRST